MMYYNYPNNQGTFAPPPQVFPFVYMQNPNAPVNNQPPAPSGDPSIDQNWRKYVRAQLLRMIHELDALDSQNDNKTTGTKDNNQK